MDQNRTVTHNKLFSTCRRLMEALMFKAVLIWGHSGSSPLLYIR
jgi:hypothetical protein